MDSRIPTPPRLRRTYRENEEEKKSLPTRHPRLRSGIRSLYRKIAFIVSEEVYYKSITLMPILNKKATLTSVRSKPLNDGATGTKNEF